MSAQLRHDSELSQYTLWVDGDQVGLAEYVIRGEDIVFVHTEIAPEHRHEGLGERLVEGALDDAHTNYAGHVVASCPFVAEFIETHPDYQDLVAQH